MGRLVSPPLVAGLLLLSLHFEQVYCGGGVFSPSCPPPEATMTHTDGLGLIEVSTNDSSTAEVLFTIKYSGSFVEDFFRCYPIGTGSNRSCPSNNQYPITFPFGGDSNAPPQLIKVQYVVFFTTSPTSSNLTCNFFVRVLDTGKPRLVCPGDVEVPGDEQGGTMGNANWTVPVPTDNSNADINLTSSIDPMTPPQTFPIGTHEISYNATDQSGNSASCSFNVIITDAEAPQFLECPTNVVNITTPGEATANVSFNLPNATDNSPDPPNVVCFIVGSSATLDNLGSILPIGTHDIQCNASDAANNVNSSCQFTILVLDKENPNITCPLNATVGTDLRQNFSTVVFPKPVEMTDNSMGYNITIMVGGGNVYAVNDSYEFQLSDTPHLVFYTITDGSGNVDMCEILITVEGM